MESLIVTLLAAAREQSPAEVLTVLLAIAYLVLAIRQNIWCWACAAGSTALSVYVFFGAMLYMESALNGFYFVMAVYGWYCWYTGGSGDELPVTVWPARVHVAALSGIAALSLASGYLLANHTDAAYPYIDSLTTWSAVWATFLLARKVLEHWWYWLVIDLTSIFIYWSRDLPLIALLFVLYVILVPFGMVSWTRSLRMQTA